MLAQLHKVLTGQKKSESVGSTAAGVLKRVGLILTVQCSVHMTVVYSRCRKEHKRLLLFSKLAICWNKTMVLIPTPVTGEPL